MTQVLIVPLEILPFLVERWDLVKTANIEGEEVLSMLCKYFIAKIASQTQSVVDIVAGTMWVGFMLMTLELQISLVLHEYKM